LDVTPGTVAYWRELCGQGKFIYVSGVCPATRDVLWFPISSQEKWCKIEPHCREMVEIPKGTAEYLSIRSFIQCFFELQRTPIDTFNDLDRRGYINWRGRLEQFIPAIREILASGPALLTEYECEAALRALPKG
jgi:hypothetical protein